MSALQRPWWVVSPPQQPVYLAQQAEHELRPPPSVRSVEQPRLVPPNPTPYPRPPPPSVMPRPPPRCAIALPLHPQPHFVQPVLPPSPVPAQNPPQRKTRRDASVITTVDGDLYVVVCPNCGGGCVISQRDLNCQVFRHAVVIATGQPLNPHAGQAECERMLTENKIRGCGAPFRFDGETATKCGYI